MRNLTLLTDFYQLTMMYGYHKHGIGERDAVFDLFFRTPSSSSSYAIMAGLEQAIEYIENLEFTDQDIAYLRGRNAFDEDFLDRLKSFKFTGELYAMPEGSVVFPYEPLVRVRAPLIQAQFIETALLNIINFETLIATKAGRVVQAAQGDRVMEFGLRRAQGPDAGVFGARAAIIGGCDATSNVLAGQKFGLTVSGTHAHSWIMSFPDELSSFRAYADVFPKSCMLLVDTYDTLRSGVPNAITVFKELREKGYEPVGIRLDSGDLAYLSKRARRMLDEAGFEKAVICASGDLDEELIWDLKAQGAAINVWGVGTRMITGDTTPALGGVYKLSAEGQDGQLVPKIKISDNSAKITNPGYKMVHRIYINDMAIADLIALDDEVFDTRESLEIFDPEETWKRMVLTDYTMRPMLVPIFKAGRRVYELPSLADIRAYGKRELDSLWNEYKRLRNPHVYKVDLSQKLYDLKQALLKQHR